MILRELLELLHTAGEAEEALEDLHSEAYNADAPGWRALDEALHAVQGLMERWRDLAECDEDFYERALERMFARALQFTPSDDFEVDDVYVEGAGAWISLRVWLDKDLVLDEEVGE